MPIYTTYLAFLNKNKDAAEKLGSCFVYYVARNRGNNEVAPSGGILELVKEGKIDWIEYEHWYLTICLPQEKAQKWMERRAEEAKIGNILLVCYEKHSTHCHRRLLAEEIAKRFNVEYKGEVT